ncbi:MAG: chromosomal replication initiator protein DnaA [Planctomycetes bacterium]|nr:chromosomal replication initiator protein DnaA [Planctomycetota bacterium]
MQTQIQGIEDRIRNRIAEIVGPQKYKIWFKNSTQFSHGDGYLKVGVPNLFIGSFIEDHFADVIQQVAAEIFETPLQISYAIDPVLFRKLRKSQLNSQAAFMVQGADRNGNDLRDPDAAATNGNGAQRVESTSRKPRGRLDQFVVGSNNRMAYTMVMSIVENPLAESTPLFIYSGCGLGKTHLLQGIANGLSEQQPDVRWLYVSGEEFTNQFILALRERRLDAFRHRFRDIDVLLLDDMQFIANKKATQEEFLHTFNAINANAKRVVLASDAHPKMMSDLSESLTNRIVAGMVVKIDRPDKATRCEILRRRAALTQHAVPAPVIDYIAEKINANVRELEGCLVKLIAYASLTKSEVTLDLARQALEDHLTQTGKLLTISDIEQNVATFFGLTPADLHTSRNPVQLRWLATLPASGTQAHKLQLS